MTAAVTSRVMTSTFSKPTSACALSLEFSALPALLYFSQVPWQHHLCASLKRPFKHTSRPRTRHTTRVSHKLAGRMEANHRCQSTLVTEWRSWAVSSQHTWMARLSPTTGETSMALQRSHLCSRAARPPLASSVLLRCCSESLVEYHDGRPSS